MENNYLITGYHGVPHVTSENDRGINAGIVGVGKFVLPVGKQFKAEYIGNNTVRMYDGKLIDNGAFAGIPAGEYIDLFIANASQGMNRNDLIVFAYGQDSSTLVESGTFYVVQGSETSGTAYDPQVYEDDLLSGRADFDIMPLWRVPVSTGTIYAPEPLFEVSKSLAEAGSGNNIVVDAFSSDGVSYTATVEDLEELYNGLEITIIPNIASTTTAPTLNVNGLGAKPIRLSLSLNNSMLVQPGKNDYYAAGRPIKLLFDANYLSTGAWRVSNKQRPSAEDLYGIIPVRNGGLGVDSIQSGNFLIGNGEEHIQEMSPEEVLFYICASEFTQLWKNASPDSSFGGQGIAVSSLSDYLTFAIVTNNGTFLYSTTTAYPQTMVFTDLDVEDNSIKVYMRTVTVNGNALTITDNYKMNINDYNGYDNDKQEFLVPYGVYGVYKKE